MLKIVNQYGREMDLASDQVITVDKYNPLFNDPDKLFQDISYPGTAPLTENNKIFFGMGHLVEANNETYSMPAQFYSDEIQLCSGLISYRMSSDPVGFQFNLEPNLTAVNGLLKNIRLTELRTEDANYFESDTDNAAFEAYMLDTVQNPDKYPHIFFPVRNPGFGSSSLAHSYHWVNKFDPDLQAFVTTPLAGDEMWQTAQTPYWKLGYIIKQVASYLGFTATGSFFTNPETKNLCIYSRRSDFRTRILPSMMYMPNILVSDFLKFIRERLHIAMDFDLISGVLTVETYKTIASAEKVVDLTPYITETLEQEVPDQQAFTVTLKSDDDDAAFKVTDAQGNDTYPPLFTLVAGDGDTAQDLDCSTLKGIDPTVDAPLGSKWCSTSQSNVNDGAWNPLPGDISYNDISDPTSLNNWSLRLINFLGFQPVTGGNFPNSEPDDLDEDDIDYYRFLNDSKRLIITAYIPPSVLAGMKMTDKYTHRSAGLNYITYILEQVSYDAPIDTDKIPVKLYVRVLNFSVNTKVTITPTAPISSTAGFIYNAARVKAYFDPVLHGITQLQLVVSGLGGLGYVYTVDPIVSPATIKGTGGVAVNIISATGALVEDLELRVYQGQPKYILHFGKRINFVQVDNYFTATISPQEHFPVFDDFVIFF